MLAPAAHAAMSDRHTLVVRGRVTSATGAPVSGAVISTHGGFSITTTTDDRGRYTLSIPLGTAAGLRAGALSLETRAESGGRRVPLSTGPPALGIELSLSAGGTTVRVRSNLQDATTALATAFAQDGASTAWVDADFGGGARASGGMELRIVDDVDASGRHASRTVPVIPAPVESVSRPAPSAAVATPEPVRAPGADTAARPPVPAAGRPPKTAAARKPSRSHARASAHTPSAAAPLAESPVATQAPPPADPPVAAPATPPPSSASGAARVRPIESFAAPVPGAFDTCACRLFGTVEIDWERPLERDFPIELTLTGPATQQGEVEMFMGSPREFRLGPLPCGEYKLIVRPRGRYQYRIVRGDSVLKVHCAGVTQARVVLVPR